MFLLGYVVYETWRCFDKYMSKVRSVDVVYDEQNKMAFPSFTFCPHYHTHQSRLGPIAYDTKVLQQCQKTAEELEMGWYGGSGNCTPEYIFEKTLPKLTDFEIKLIKVWSADGYNFVSMNISDSRLAWKEWILPGLGKCFTMTLSRELTKDNQGIGDLEITTGKTQFRIFLHSLGRFIGWPSYSTGVSGWYIKPGGSVNIHMETMEFMEYQDNEDGICINNPGYLQDECFADLVNVRSADLGCQVPYGTHQSPLCENLTSAEQAGRVLWATVFEETLCKSPCQFMMSAISSKSNTDTTMSNDTLLTFTFKRQVKKSISRVSYGKLELMAEIGGYVGLFLGLSFFHIGDELYKKLHEFCHSIC